MGEFIMPKCRGLVLRTAVITTIRVNDKSVIYRQYIYPLLSEATEKLSAMRSSGGDQVQSQRAELALLS